MSQQQSAASVARIILVLLLSPLGCHWGLRPVTPKLLPLFENILSPCLHLGQRDFSRDPGEFAQVQLSLSSLLILDHLQEQLNLVNVVHKVALERLGVLVLLPDCADLLARCSTYYIAQQILGQEVHGLGFAAALFEFGDAVDRGDVADEEFSHVVNQAHLGASREIELGSERGRGEHGDQGHAVHVIGDRLSSVNYVSRWLHEQHNTCSSYLSIPNRRHPSRFVVLSLSSMWKKGKGEDDPSAGTSPEMPCTALSTVQSPETFTTGVKPRSVIVD